MSNEPAYVGLFEVETDEGLVDAAVDICGELGFDTSAITHRESTLLGDIQKTVVPHENFSLIFSVDADAEDAPYEDDLAIELHDNVYLSSFGDEESHANAMDIVFELLCRLAMRLDAEYVAVYGMDQPGEVPTPNDYPIDAGLSRAPRFGIYTPELLEAIGGTETFYDDTPWYQGQLRDGRVVVIASQWPWGEGGWTPPAAAEYIATDSTEQESGEETLILGDPFAELEPGEYGADIVIPQAHLDAGFDDETVELVRVYVDDEWRLRRVDDDSFVRNVVTDTTGSKDQILDRMVAGRPRGVDADDVPLSVLVNDDVPLSVLVNDDVPPEFVHLAGPDAENVATLVMGLDVSLSTYDILMALVNDAPPGEGYSDGDIETIENGLETLTNVENSIDVETWIREKIL